MKRYIRSASMTEDQVPDTLASRPIGFMLNSVNSTYNDEILEIAEAHGALKVRYGYYDPDANRYFSRQRTPWRFAAPSKEVAKEIKKACEEAKIPVHQDMLVTITIDWDNCYDIWVDDWSEGPQKIHYHEDPLK